MDGEKVKHKRKFWRGLGRGVDLVRRIILNLLFWSLLVFLVLQFMPRRIRVQDNSLLYLMPEGSIVDAVTPAPFSRFFHPQGFPVETSSIELGRAIRAAAEDPQITGMALDLTDLEYASLAVMQDLEGELQYFRDQNKKIYAWAPGYNQYAFYLASQANIIYLDEMGQILLSGFGVYRSYFKKAMDKWQLDMAVFQAGEYKSYVEPYLYDRMSQGVKEENRRWTGNLWNQVLRTISLNRDLTQDELSRWVAAYPDQLERAGGDEAGIALKAGLADVVGTWETFASDMVRVTGFDNSSSSFRSIHWMDYLSTLDENPVFNLRKTVAVITASGEIQSGEGAGWNIGSQALIRQLEKAEKEPSVRAVLLRLDTGGGSAYAAEEIRRKLEIIRRRGIPVVVSMGGVAASGGYWIASESDELWSAPGTITGSIGVFSLIPETDRFLNETLGIEGDGVGTTWMSGQGRFDQPLNTSSRKVFQSGVDNTYSKFLNIVAGNRNLSREELAPLAGGRIWTGEEALEKGLCDKTGTLHDAIQGAAELAGLEEYNVWYVPSAEQSLPQQLLTSLSLIRSGRTLDILTPGFSDLVPGKVYALSPVSDKKYPKLMDNGLNWY